MAASMESSGQTRAATLMNAARRSHFVSRIEKYEAKVRHAKALMKEQKGAMAVGEQKRTILNAEGQHIAMSKEMEAVVDQMRPAFNLVEEQHTIPESRTMVPTEKALMHMQVPAGMEQKTCTHHDLPCKLYNEDLSLNKVHEKDYSPVELLHERGYLSQEEGLYQHPRGISPDQRTQTEQKEIISGVLQRSSSSNMRSIVKGIDALDMNSGTATLSEKVFPVGFIPSDAHANIYFDFKPPATMEMNITAVAGALKIRIKAADMSAPMQEHAFRCARDCLDAVGKLQSKRIAYTLKKEFDKVYGPAWHCIVGTSFGSYVTHSLGGFVYFSLDKVSVLLFKTTVEPIDNS
ncbi:hypothetical protein GOP47_0026392 [Adiantum capillus-veneris]|nr:hypothetical protein GOP47_0026392 [Adiantum capillus-veneris]